ncbi:MAG: proline dehydrogenase family protein [Nitrososphaerales archaeon]|nr:proline dehydrogenase family protein [Nitrososphaerales archaeon]
MSLAKTLLFRVAKRWIAGVDLESAIADAKRANGEGMSVIINFLGEDITDGAVSDSHARQYISLQDSISENGIEGCASVKLTQFGLGSDDEGARLRLERVASNAERLKQRLWVDMEGSRVTSRTLSIYCDAFAKHGHLGVAVQAYMRRSEADTRMLLDRGAIIRLVKGAYREPETVVFPTRREVSKKYAELLRLLFERGDNFAVATHDSELIDETKRLAESKHVSFEFQMLKGIRNEMKEDLAKSGYRVTEYLPYGASWLAYSRRRMTEHPSNVWLLLRSLV